MSTSNKRTFDDESVINTKKLKSNQTWFNYDENISINGIRENITKVWPKSNINRALIQASFGYHGVKYITEPKYTLDGLLEFENLQKDIHEEIRNSTTVKYSGFEPALWRVYDYPYVRMEGNDLIFTVDGVLDFGSIYELRSGYIFKAAPKTILYFYTDDVPANGILVEPVNESIFSLNVFGDGKYHEEIRVKVERFFVANKDYYLGTSSPNNYNKIKTTLLTKASVRNNRFFMMRPLLKSSHTIVSYNFKSLETDNEWKLLTSQNNNKLTVNDRGASISGRLLMVPRLRCAYKGIIAPSLLSYMKDNHVKVTPYKFTWSYAVNGGCDEALQPMIYNIVGVVMRSQPFIYTSVTEYEGMMTFINGNFSWVPGYGQIKRNLGAVIFGPMAKEGLAIFKKKYPNLFDEEGWEKFTSYIGRTHIDMRYESDTGDRVKQYIGRMKKEITCIYEKFVKNMNFEDALVDNIKSSIFVNDIVKKGDGQDNEKE